MGSQAEPLRALPGALRCFAVAKTLEAAAPLSGVRLERRDEDVTAKKKVVRYIAHQLCEGHDEYHDVHNVVNEGIKSEIGPFAALVHELAHR